MQWKLDADATTLWKLRVFTFTTQRKKIDLACRQKGDKAQLHIQKRNSLFQEQTAFLAPTSFVKLTNCKILRLFARNYYSRLL